LLSAYRKATDMCTLILYPANLPKGFVISNRFLIGSHGLLGIGSCHLPIG
jgi:hypothetical protein